MTGLLLAGCQQSAQTDATGVESGKPFGTPQAMHRELNIFIPASTDLTRTLRVGAVYSERHIQIRYEFETDHPSWYHDYLVYRDGAWHTLGSEPVGPEPDGLYEDRISMALADGRVEGFARYGGYLTMHPGVVSRTDEVTDEEITKFLLMTRQPGPEEDRWANPLDDAMIDRLRDEGRFLQTWQWRAHRSNPIGHGDPGYVLEARNSADGRGMYETNFDSERNQPRFMFDPALTGGRYALREDALLSKAYTQDDPYYIVEETALPFDPEHDWQDGDVLPRRYLRTPSGSRAALRAEGRWTDGVWRVRVTRTLAAPNSRDSKQLRFGERYTVAFSVHTGATHGRWHYVSMPMTLGLGVPAAVKADFTAGAVDAAEVAWTNVPLFQPGQYTSWLTDTSHPAVQWYESALRNPLDHSTIQNLADAIAVHELAMLESLLPAQPEEEATEPDSAPEPAPEPTGDDDEGDQPEPDVRF